MYMHVLLACICAHPVSAWCLRRSEEGVRPQLQEVVSCYLGVRGNQTKILCRSNKCFKLLHQLSSLELGLEFVW